MRTNATARSPVRKLGCSTNTADIFWEIELTYPQPHRDSPIAPTRSALKSLSVLARGYSEGGWGAVIPTRRSTHFTAPIPHNDNGREKHKTSDNDK